MAQATSQRSPSTSFPATSLAQHDWSDLPAGVKFVPSDRELLTHLEGKVGKGGAKLHPLIERFIPTLLKDDGICGVHPEDLPGVSKDGNFMHFFHRPAKAYNKGTRKRRKIGTCSDERWHKTGRTRPVTETAGERRGCKKIMVLYNSKGKGRKAENTPWVMHQYHLGTEEEETEGEWVVSKVFYQLKQRQCKSRKTLGSGSALEEETDLDDPCSAEKNGRKRKAELEVVHNGRPRSPAGSTAQRAEGGTVGSAGGNTSVGKSGIRRFFVPNNAENMPPKQAWKGVENDGVARESSLTETGVTTNREVLPAVAASTFSSRRGAYKEMVKSDEDAEGGATKQEDDAECTSDVGSSQEPVEYEDMEEAVSARQEESTGDICAFPPAIHDLPNVYGQVVAQGEERQPLSRGCPTNDEDTPFDLGAPFDPDLDDPHSSRIDFGAPRSDHAVVGEGESGGALMEVHGSPQAMGESQGFVSMLHESEDHKEFVNDLISTPEDDALVKPEPGRLSGVGSQVPKWDIRCAPSQLPLCQRSPLEITTGGTVRGLLDFIKSASPRAFEVASPVETKSEAGAPFQEVQVTAKKEFKWGLSSQDVNGLFGSEVQEPDESAGQDFLLPATEQQQQQLPQCMSASPEPGIAVPLVTGLRQSRLVRVSEGSLALVPDSRERGQLGVSRSKRNATLGYVTGVADAAEGVLAGKTRTRSQSRKS
eukprot:jgi/Mesen1/2030/ME000148S01132